MNAALDSGRRMAFVKETASWLRSIGNNNQNPSKHERETGSSRLPLSPTYFGKNSEQPGNFPFTRGIDPCGYLNEPWVMGMYSGYATPRETNARFKTLLATGQTGLSIALDLPTQVGINSDHPMAMGEIGKVGVPINSVEDMLALLDGLPIDQVRQMRSTANAIGPMFLAFVLVALEELGINSSSFRLFLQNDPLKEFPARGTWIFPPAASLRLAMDVVEYIAQHHPTWQPQQYCGYHIRDAGGTAVQEVAVAIANGIAYLEEARHRGLDIAALAPTMFFFLAAGLDIFEEIAKFRAARRLWAKLLHDRFGVPKERCAIRIFAYTLGGALQAREPMNNVARIAYEALAAALGGVQTLATSSWDEAHSLPSESAANLSVRTQQILAYESGVANVVDPLGGSWYVEDLTDRLESSTATAIAEIMDRGGAVSALESGYIETILAESAYRDFQDIESGRKTIVGLNFKPRENDDGWNADFEMPKNVTSEVIASLERTRFTRNGKLVQESLQAIAHAATRGENVLPSLIEAARRRVTLGEMTEALASVFGYHNNMNVNLPNVSSTS